VKGQKCGPGWNHNFHYHGFVLDQLPAHCQRALDVGCGEGQLALKLAESCDEVIGIDVDAATLGRAKALVGANPRVALHLGDVLTYEFAESSFDFIGAVASLHHLPLRPSLARFRALLRPGGTLAVVGLYRLSTPMDYAMAGLAIPSSWLIQLGLGAAEVAAPISAPNETLHNIRRTVAELLPGARVQRRLFHRYTLVWRKG
jgi:SAM-dependent methyltransferase